MEGRNERSPSFLSSLLVGVSEEDAAPPWWREEGRRGGESVYHSTGNPGGPVFTLISLNRKSPRINHCVTEAGQDRGVLRPCMSGQISTQQRDSPTGRDAGGGHSLISEKGVPGHYHLPGERPADRQGDRRGDWPARLRDDQGTWMLNAVCSIAS